MEVDIVGNKGQEGTIGEGEKDSGVTQGEVPKGGSARVRKLGREDELARGRGMLLEEGQGQEL